MKASLFIIPTEYNNLLCKSKEKKSGNNIAAADDAKLLPH